MTQRQNRRKFMKVSAAASAGFWAAGGVSAKASTSAIETINFACVGVGGKGTSDSNDAARHGNIVAICDIDENNLGKAAAKWPKAKKFFDYRKMIEEMADSADAVTVSTPDHNHAPASALALKAGLNCFTQKPLTHSIEEARVLGNLAKKHGVKSQMGNQGTASSNLRHSAALLKGGVVGDVKEVHVWTDRPVWPTGIDRPKEELEAPAHLHWNEFIGPAKFRPYHEAYHPFKWRGWWDFGTGALGDMGCHNQDLAYWALDLRDPVSLESKHSGVNDETAPKWSIVTYQFPKTKTRGPVKLTWYDGGKKPAPVLVKEKQLPRNGSIIIGTKDTLYVPMYWGGGKFLSGAKMSDFDKIDEFLPKPKDFGRHHYQEWIDACKGGKPAHSNFDYAGPMTESVLLANVALRAGGKIRWDAAKMRVTNNEAADRFVRHEYRGDWKL